MAGLIPQHFINDLLTRIDIVDVIQRHVPLKRSGSNFSACCPFHNEKTPSFTVSQTKQFYHCFGCQASGSAISFLMEYEQMHFVDAIESLAQMCGVEVPREAAAQQDKDNRKPLYATMQLCVDYYAQQLKTSPVAIKYLKQRGISGETAKRFGLGFAPDGWDELQPVVKAEHQQLIKLGMMIKNDKGRIYDRFRERIMFPIRDQRGRVIGFGGRVMHSGEPKYLNSPETPLFHKGKELYGFFEARKTAQQQQTMIIVEGYMDVIALSQQGIENTVATLGTATTPEHIEILFRAVADIVFCFDGDRAGREAAWRALKATLPALKDGYDAHFLFLDDGEDPDSFVAKQGPDAFYGLLKEAKPISDFLFEHLCLDLDISQIGGKARLAELAKPLINDIPQGIYKKLCQDRLQTIIGTQVYQPDSLAYSSTPSDATRRRRPNTDSRGKPSFARRAITLIIQKPFLVQTIDPEDYKFPTNDIGNQLLMQLIAVCDNHIDISTGTLLEQFRDSEHWKALNQLAITPLMPDGKDPDDDNVKNEYRDIITRLNRQNRQRDADKLNANVKTGLMSLRRH